jgi:hypothetical protein
VVWFGLVWYNLIGYMSGSNIGALWRNERVQLGEENDCWGDSVRTLSS